MNTTANYSVTEVYINEQSLESPVICDPLKAYNFSAKMFPNPTIINAPYDWSDYLKIIVCVVAIVITLIGNCSVIIAVTLNSRLRTTVNYYNYYITNLAVADILICVTCFWVFLVKHLTQASYVLGPVMCRVSGFSQVTCLIASVLTLTIITLDRFMAVFFPLRSRFTKQRTGSVITIIWVISLIIGIPLFMYRSLHEIRWNDFTEINCIEKWPEVEVSKCRKLFPWKKAYYLTVSVTLFFVPVIIMGICNSLIIWRLWFHTTPGEITASDRIRDETNKKKVVKMVCIMMSCFVICWFPLQIVLLYSQFRHKRGLLPSWFTILSNVGTPMAYTNSILNPFIYSGFNPTFRQTLYSILRLDFRSIGTNDDIPRTSSVSSIRGNRSSFNTMQTTTM